MAAKPHRDAWIKIDGVVGYNLSMSYVARYFPCREARFPENEFPDYVTFLQFNGPGDVMR